ncbi:hypothetical protein B0H14DRAFT_3046355 [Mycena olivaceomarginata]|nr:hypothetical protein B0H14DRAFT_3046355 [Mycena olivaceomarginata]
MEALFFAAGGWDRYPETSDRRCYPNSLGRNVHIWGSAKQDYQPTVIGGFATFDRLEVREMLEFMGVLYANQAYRWVLAGDFDKAVEATMDAPLRLNDSDERVVPNGHYVWFKRTSATRLGPETPITREWPLSSRIITAPGSAGTMTPTRNDSIRGDRRKLDGRCRITGRRALDRDPPRGKDWTSLHSAHVFPLAWSIEQYMRDMFDYEGFQMIQECGLHQTDAVINTILMDARVHGWFDDYRFGIWPVRHGVKWYGRILRVEHSGCDVDGDWLLAAAPPVQFPRPGPGQRESGEQRKNRVADERDRGDDRTRYDLTDEVILRQLLKVHFETCLHWHVKGMGWDK